MRGASRTVSDEYRIQSHGWRNRLASGIALPRCTPCRLDARRRNACDVPVPDPRRNKVPVDGSVAGTHRPGYSFGTQVFRERIAPLEEDGRGERMIRAAVSVLAIAAI